MTDIEDYTRAKTLATIEHLGRTFRVVRRRINGKPWRGYLALVYDGFAMTSDFPAVKDAADVAECCAWWRERLQRTFADNNDSGRSAFEDAISSTIETVKREREKANDQIRHRSCRNRAR